jgi:nucleolar protein 53
MNERKRTSYLTHVLYIEPVDDTPVNDFIPEKVKPKKPQTEKPLAAVHIEAIKLPEAGASYNPTAEEHQKLLIKANEVEERKAEALAKLQEQLAYREELNQLADEVTAGQTVSDEEEEEEEEDDEEMDEQAKQQAEKRKKLLARNGGRKTRAERNKEYRLACEKVKKKIANHEKSIRKQIDKLKQIEVELDERDEAIEKLTGETSQRKLEKEKQGKTKLGKYIIQDLPIDFQLTEELSETLRQLKVFVYICIYI